MIKNSLSGLVIAGASGRNPMNIHHGARGAYPVLALAGLSVLIRIYLSMLPHAMKGDEGAYIWLGQSIATGQGFTLMGMPEVHLNPLFPIVIAAIYRLTGVLEESGTVAFVVFGGLLAVPVYLLTRRIFGKTEATIAGLLIAIHPALTAYLFYEAGLSETIYLFTMFFGLYSLHKGLQDKRPLAYLAAGALLGLSYLARSEGIQLLLFALALLLLVALLRRELLRTSTAFHAGLLVCSFSLFALPYVFYLHQETGDWMVSGKPWIAYMQNRSLAQGDLITFDKLTWGLDKSGREVVYFSQDKFDRSLFTEIAGDPGAAADQFRGNLTRLGSLIQDPKTVPLFMWALVGVGLFGASWNRRRALGEAVLFIAVLAALLPAMLMYPIVRFMAPAFPVMLIWSAVGLVRLRRWLVGTARRVGLGRLSTGSVGSSGWYVAVALVAVYFLAAYPSVITTQQPELAKNLAEKQVGTVIRSQIQPNSVVMSRDGIVAMYTGQKWAPFPNAEYEKVIGYARSHNVRYLVVEEWSIKVTNPQLAFLLDETSPPSNLKVLSTQRTSVGKFVLYELIGG